MDKKLENTSAQPQMLSNAGSRSKQRAQKAHKKGLLKALSAAVFVIFAGVLFIGANLTIGFTGNAQNQGAWTAFYDTEENIIDVGVIGTSATSRFLVNPLSYKQEGIASFSIASQGTPLFLYDEIMSEYLTRQSPSLFVIELRSAIKEGTYLTEGKCRGTIDSVSLFSPYRIDMINESLEKMEAILDPSEYDSEFIDYLFPVVKYHSRLLEEDMTLEKLTDKHYNATQGFYLSGKTLSQAELEGPYYSEKIGTLSEAEQESLQSLLDYCEGVDAEILFILAPKVCQDQEESEEFNAVADYVTQQGWNCLNMNTYELFEEIGLDPATDFYNSNHTNYLGAEKYTKWFSTYLKEHYDLPDRRGDETYSAWEDGYEEYLTYTAQGIKNTSKNEIADEG